MSRRGPSGFMEAFPNLLRTTLTLDVRIGSVL